MHRTVLFAVGTGHEAHRRIECRVIGLCLVRLLCVSGEGSIDVMTASLISTPLQLLSRDSSRSGSYHMRRAMLFSVATGHESCRKIACRVVNLSLVRLLCVSGGGSICTLTASLMSTPLQLLSRDSSRSGSYHMHRAMLFSVATGHLAHRKIEFLMHSLCLVRLLCVSGGGSICTLARGYRHR